MLRYDRDDYDCESLRFARDRARSLYRQFYKKTYAGDVEDLEQAAMMAIVAVGEAADDRDRLPDEVVFAAIDKAVAAEVGGFRRQSFDLTTAPGEEDRSIYSGVPDREPSGTGPEKAAAAAKVRHSVVHMLGEERTTALFRYLVDGACVEAVAAERSALHPRTPVTVDRTRAELAEDERRVATYLPFGGVSAVRELLETRDRPQ